MVVQIISCDQWTFIPKKFETINRSLNNYTSGPEEILLTKGRGDKQFAYLKAAWSVDLQKIFIRYLKRGGKGHIALNARGMV